MHSDFWSHALTWVWTISLNLRWMTNIYQWSIPQGVIAKLINCAVSDKKLSRPLTYTWPRSSISEIARFFTNSPTARITRSMSPFNQEGHIDRRRQMATESGAPWRLLVLCRTNRWWSTFYTRVYLYLSLYLYSYLSLCLIIFNSPTWGFLPCSPPSFAGCGRWSPSHCLKYFQKINLFHNRCNVCLFPAALFQCSI